MTPGVAGRGGRAAPASVDSWPLRVLNGCSARDLDKGREREPVKPA
jgi:hypothetical protein